MIRTPMADKMMAEGQGDELNAMLEKFVPMKRMGRPEEIADAVLWLVVRLRIRSRASRSLSMAAMSCVREGSRENHIVRVSLSSWH